MGNNVAFMCWKIGEVFDIFGQFEFLKEHGFTAVSFHGSRGNPPAWSGAPLLDMSEEEIGKVEKAISCFEKKELHMPFAYELNPYGVAPLDDIKSVLEKAKKTGIDVATLHSVQTDKKNKDEYKHWISQIKEIDRATEGAIKVGLELTGGFDVLGDADTENVKLTLDVGHMTLSLDPCKTGIEEVQLEKYDSWENLISEAAPYLIHTHIHDNNGTVDHIALGKGFIDYKPIFAKFKEIGYDGMYCLELNPSRVTTEELLESADYIRSVTGAR